ncbi:cellulose biosynthesis cyclic di-GMP-binding regulatory protein BcsB [Acidithiobacillus ferrooxidans]|nr:cellulose biosynthesis cyclic di-GMP-binding regulatory protein BcsB [Acidithiobacillus ferrooxidans]
MYTHFDERNLEEGSVRERKRLNQMRMRLVPMLFLLHGVLAWGAYAKQIDLGLSNERPGKASPQKVQNNGLFVENPLSYYLGGDAVQNLKFVHAHMNISIPVPQLATVQEATMNLKLTPSAALDDQSWMAVYLNRQVVAQFPLKGQEGAFNQNITLPGKYFRTGYNTLRLEVSQHYTKVCEYPMAPQLWTQVDTAGSNLKIRFTPKNWVPLLSGLDSLFDKTSFSAQPVVSIFYGQEPQAGSLNALALAAQGAALRYQYLPVRMNANAISARHLEQWLTQTGAEGSAVSLWVGTATSLSLLWQDLHIPAPKGAWMGTYVWPNHPHHYIVILTGDTQEQVRQTAKIFAQPRIVLPPVSQAQITGLQLPDRQKVAQPVTSRIFGHGAFSLLATGFHTTSLTGYAPPPAGLRIWNGGWDRKAQLHLHLAYAAGMATQSALNVLVNGTLQGSIPLNQPTGGRYSNYTVTIPPTIMHPGWNTVSLQPRFIPVSNGGECKPFFMGNLWVTIYDDSIFEWEGNGVTAQQPDLATLAADGYPYTKKSLGEDMHVQVPDLQPATLSAALTLMGKIAQVGKRPYPMARLVAGVTPAPNTGIFVAPWANIPPEWRHHLQVTANHIEESFPVGRSAQDFSGILSIIRPQATGDSVVRGQMSLNADLGSLAFATTWEQDGHPLALFTAATAESLSKGMDSLVDYGPWSQLKGTLAWWTPGGKKVTSLGLDEEPFRNYGLRGGLSLWISRHPWFSLLGIAMIGLLFVLATRLALRAYSRKHHSKEF